MIPEHYREVVELIQSHGFNLIAITTMQCEDTFYLETEKEAKLAYEYFELGENIEREKLCDGWWYSIEEKDENEKNYFNNYGYIPDVYFVAPHLINLPNPEEILKNVNDGLCLENYKKEDIIKAIKIGMNEAIKFSLNWAANNAEIKYEEMGSKTNLTIQYLVKRCSMIDKKSILKGIELKTFKV